MTAQPHALTTALALAGLALAAGSLPGLAAAQGTPAAAPAGRPAAAAAAARAPADPAPAGNAKATLAQQARSWEDRGRADFAAAAWRKLLAAEPANIDALYGLALAQVNLGQPQAAAEPLAALRRARPEHPGLRKLDQHLAQGSTDAGLLKEARRLAAASQYDAAARDYELLLSDRTPQGPIALEYYQTLGGTTTGWEPARRGLERLARSETGDPRYALALARHLSYREPSRRDAIRQLAALARSGPAAGPGAVGDSAAPALGAEQRPDAREAWRQALVWLDAREADQPLYRQFLEAGDDASIRTRLASLQQGLEDGRRTAEARDPAARGRRQAFDALGNGDLAGAAERFQRVLKDKPRDTDALGGLGVVRLREGRLAEARELLGQAVAGSGGSTSTWQKGLQSVDLRLVLQQAELALTQRQPQQALDLARQAAQLDAQDPAAPLTQGEALLELGQPVAAEAAFRQALALAPASDGAWRGVLRALHAQGRSDAAAQLVDALDDDAARRLGGRASLGADHLRLSAETLRRRGDLVGAQAQLEQALQLDPQTPWVRLALAQLVLAQGQEAQARALMDDLQPAARHETDAWWARAQWHAELKEPQAGLAALDHIAPAERQPEMARLHRRLRVAALVARAQAQSGQGQAGAAQASLQQAQAAAGNEAELLPAIASAYAELGQGARAQQLLRSALGQESARAGSDGGGAPRVALQLQYATLLQAGRQDVELAAALGALQGQPMSPAQREQFDGLRLGLALRQVDQLREAGDSAEAYEVLAPLLAERPADSRLKLALARLHASVGDGDTTLETLDSVLISEPDSLDVWLAAAAIATGLREHDYALAALQRAEAIAPQDSRVLAQYSRHYRARGELGRAAEYMRAAIASQRPAGSSRAGARAGSSAQWGRPLGSANPFAARTTPGGSASGASSGVPSGALAGSLSDAEADATPRRLPPLPGASPSTTLPGDTGPRTIPSSEDWLRGGRSDRVDRLTRTVARTPAWPDPSGGQPAHLVYPNQSAYLANPADAATSGASTGGAPTLSALDAPSRGSAAAPRAGAALRRPAQPAGTDTGAYPTTTDVGSAVIGLSATPALLAQAGRRLPPGLIEPQYERQYEPQYEQQQAPQRPLLPPPPATLPREAALAPAAASRSLRDELAEIVAERGSREVEGAAALRWRNGEGGMSQLVELRSPINLQVPLGDLGRLQLGLAPTLVDAGTSPTDAEAASRLGSQALGGTAAASNVSGAGVGLRLGLAGRRWAADLGTTPLGFRVLNVVGGLKFGGEFTPQLGYGVELQRRAVTDSVLSYAGMRDPRTGTVWGGVTATGLSGSLQWKDGDLRLGAYAGLAALAGRGVRSNEKLELGAAATWRVSDEARQRVEVGTRIGYQHHTHNLRYFTLGHGGYFSPQHQLALELPIKVVGRDQRLSWSLGATPGLSAWREDAAPYFATDAQAQAQLRTLVALGLTTQSSYASRSSFGLSLGLQGGTEYLLSDRLLLGGRLSLDSASQYTQLGAGLYLRLRLDADAVTPRNLVEPAPRHD